MELSFPRFQAPIRRCNGLESNQLLTPVVNLRYSTLFLPHVRSWYRACVVVKNLTLGLFRVLAAWPLFNGKDLYLCKPPCLIWNIVFCACILVIAYLFNHSKKVRAHLRVAHPANISLNSQPAQQSTMQLPYVLLMFPLLAVAKAPSAGACAILSSPIKGWKNVAEWKDMALLVCKYLQQEPGFEQVYLIQGTADDFKALCTAPRGGQSGSQPDPISKTTRVWHQFYERQQDTTKAGNCHD